MSYEIHILQLKQIPLLLFHEIAMRTFVFILLSLVFGVAGAQNERELSVLPVDSIPSVEFEGLEQGHRFFNSPFWDDFFRLHSNDFKEYYKISAKMHPVQKYILTSHFIDQHAYIAFEVRGAASFFHAGVITGVYAHVVSYLDGRADTSYFGTVMDPATGTFRDVPFSMLNGDFYVFVPKNKKK